MIDNECRWNNEIINIISSYFLIGPTAQQTRSFAWLKDHLPQDGSVQLNDVTSMYTAINVLGPRAQDLLSELTDTSLTKQDFFSMTCKVGIWALKYICGFWHVIVINDKKQRKHQQPEIWKRKCKWLSYAVERLAYNLFSIFASARILARRAIMRVLSNWPDANKCGVCSLKLTGTLSKFVSDNYKWNKIMIEDQLNTHINMNSPLFQCWLQLVVFHLKQDFLSNFVLILIIFNLSLWVLYYTVKLWNAHFWTTLVCSFTCYQRKFNLLKSSL